MCKKNSLLQLQVQNHKKPFYSSGLGVHERSIFPSVKHNWHFRESPTPFDSDLIRPEYTCPSGYLGFHASVRIQLNMARAILKLNLLD